MSLTILSAAYPLAPVSLDAVGGAEQVLAELDRALVQRDHRSIVVACEGSRVCGELVAVPAEAGTLDDAAKQRAWARHRQALADVLTRERVDLVHLHGIDFHAYVPASAPTLVTMHLPLDWYPSEAWSDRPYLWRHPVSASQARTAPPGAQLLAPIPNGVAVDQLGGRFAKRNFALNLGRICPEKGVHLALDAAHQAGMPLLIGGKVYRYQTHEQYFASEVEPRLDRQRRFLGPLGFRAKRRLLAQARCLLVPSLAPETSSLVAMEALASGTPVIAFPNGALPDIVEHGKTGFLVENVADMAQSIHRLDQIDPAECRRVAVDRFSLDRVVDDYLALYSRLAAEAKAQSALDLAS